VHEASEAIQDYALSGEPRYLQAYEKSARAIPRAVREVGRLSSDNPAQQRRVASLDKALEGFFAGCSRAAASGMPAAGPAFRGGLAARQRDMAEVLKVVDSLVQEEESLLRRRQEQENRNSRELSLVLLGRSFFLVLITVLAARVFSRHIRAERAAKDELRQKDQTLFQFLEGLPIGVFVADAQGKPYYANREGMQLLGRGIFGQPVKDSLAETYQAYVAGTDQLYPKDKLAITKAMRGERSMLDDMEIH
jgi:CHASE3 domain sensor protein